MVPFYLQSFLLDQTPLNSYSVDILSERKYCQLFTSSFSVTHALQNAVKMNGQEKPKNWPFPTVDLNPHLIHNPWAHHTYQPPQTVALSLHALLHNYATQSPWLQWDDPYLPPKLPLPVGGTPPQPDFTLPWNHLTQHPKWHLTHLKHHVTVHSQTDQQNRNMFCSSRPLMLCDTFMRPNNGDQSDCDASVMFLTWVVPDKIQRAVKRLCVCLCVCVCALAGSLSRRRKTLIQNQGLRSPLASSGTSVTLSM